MSAIPRIRSGLYRSARLLGDVQAVSRGRVGQRLVNRGLGRLVRKIAIRQSNPTPKENS